MAALSPADRLLLISGPGKAGGGGYPPAAILNLLTVAILRGTRGLGATAQFGRGPAPSRARELGLRRPGMPCKATPSNLLRRLDPGRAEAALRARAADRVGHPVHLARAGETLRGPRDDLVPAVHRLAAYAVEAGVTPARVPVGGRTNGHRAALAFLRGWPLSAATLTADAMLAHRDLCQGIRDGGGDCLLPVEKNRPTSRSDIQAAFAARPGLSPPAESVDRGPRAAGSRRHQSPRSHPRSGRSGPARRRTAIGPTGLA